MGWTHRLDPTVIDAMRGQSRKGTKGNDDRRPCPQPRAEAAEVSIGTGQEGDDPGERAGTRTLDILIKSQALYRLSYALPPRETQG